MNGDFWFGWQDASWWRTVAGLVGIYLAAQYAVGHRELKVWFSKVRARFYDEAWYEKLADIVMSVISVLSALWVLTLAFTVFSGMLGLGFSLMFGIPASLMVWHVYRHDCRKASTD